MVFYDKADVIARNKNMNKSRRLKKARKGVMKAERKLIKAREERIWIENNPKIHILNYPFYKLIRKLR
jgi:hypothetical protein